MAKWGYAFPPEWDDAKVSARDRWVFELAGVGRRLRWEALMRLKAFRRKSDPTLRPASS